MVTPPKPASNRAQASIPTLLVALVGLALLGSATYAHFSIAGATRCDGCTPWHPLFVLAPLVGGAAFVASAGLLYAR